jgi:pimeloyl-ACP methyl ester carboxylesterase
MPFVINNDIKIHYHIDGDGDPLVLMHGFMGSIESWYTLGYIRFLSQKFMVISIDARGHGSSDKPHFVNAYLDKTMAEDVIAVINQLKLGKVNYFGFSMGGRIGFELLAYYPDRFSSMILAGQTPGPRTEFGKQSDSKRLALFEKGTEIYRKVLRKSPSEFGSYLNAALQGDLHAFISKTKANALRLDISELVSNHTIPCLIYAGSLDKLSHDSAQEYSHKIKSAKFISIPEINHMESIAKTDLIIPIIQEFLGINTLS